MIERQVAGGGFAMGPAFTLADCAALPALFYGGTVEAFGAERPQLAAYLERLKARPAVARVLAEAEPYFKMVPQEN